MEPGRIPNYLNARVTGEFPAGFIPPPPKREYTSDGAHLAGLLRPLLGEEVSIEEQRSSGDRDSL